MGGGLRRLDLLGESLEELVEALTGGRLDQPLADAGDEPSDLRFARVRDQRATGVLRQRQRGFAFDEPSGALRLDFHPEALGRRRVKNLDASLVSALDRADADFQFGAEAAVRILLHLFASRQTAGEHLGIHQALPDEVTRGQDGVGTFEFHDKQSAFSYTESRTLSRRSMTAQRSCT